MPRFISNRTRRSRSRAVAVAGLSAFAVLGAILVLAGSSAAAGPTTVGLGTASSFAILAQSGISDVPASAITGNVGIYPATGTSITGLTCPEVNGRIFTRTTAGPPCRRVNANALLNATNDVTTAFNDAAGRSVPPLNVFGAADKQLDGQTLVPGVYQFGHATNENLSTTLTLNGSASSVWIFQATSDLVFGSGSTVNLTGGASACNVFWQVGSDATIRTGANVVGTILAGTSIHAQTGATITGRLLAAAAVTLDHNTVNRSTCGASSVASSGQAPGRALYCDSAGKTYDLVKGEDKEYPYDALNLVPAYVNPLTGAESCNFPAAAVTTTTTATTTTAPPPVTTTTSTSKPPAKKTKGGVKAAKRVHIAHVAPKPARHQGGFTG